ncbi:MAG: hypothetical protein Q8K60_05355 [Parachlamydiaceae bacterium]|nr:hypothetical protein [Parachlamydiaceae bacterium]
MFEDPNTELSPIHFFTLQADCHSLLKAKDNPDMTKHLLPLTKDLTREESFANVAMGWHPEGLAFQIQVSEKHTQSFYPNLEKGDSIELWIDTRDVKTSGFNTRFCHHFFFLPVLIDGIDKGEITHFRTEDSHPLCDEKLLLSKVTMKKNGYHIQIFIPSQCLYGYDPNQFDRLGFTYRINRAEGEPQHFAVISPDFQIEQQPSLWGSLKMVK